MKRLFTIFLCSVSILLFGCETSEFRSDLPPSILNLHSGNSYVFEYSVGNSSVESSINDKIVAKVRIRDGYLIGTNKDDIKLTFEELSAIDRHIDCLYFGKGVGNFHNYSQMILKIYDQRRKLLGKWKLQANGGICSRGGVLRGGLYQSKYKDKLEGAFWRTPNFFEKYDLWVTASEESKLR